MSKLKTLKGANSLHDIAKILGFKPKALAYILYKKGDAAKYQKFEIPKRTGGTRTISAPSDDLKNLQSRLSELLQDCVEEINQPKNFSGAISHGFRRGHSIITNASAHKNRRYVFNIDLENFFGTINFGRVRGFFIKNKNFELSPAAATVVTQIACFENSLPQGSPCSPVISNLVAHILDIRLAKLAHKTGCHYSRYADDLTFSTNKPTFPIEIAKPVEEEANKWVVGDDLNTIVGKAGFAVNSAKTRMQLERSRQDVTGLVVNRKVNTRVEYRRSARAMTDRLLKQGKFYRKQVSVDENGNEVISEVDGTVPELNGILSFINSPRMHRIKSFLERPQKNKEHSRKINAREVQIAFPLNSNETLYGDLLFYKDFHAPASPLIVCEGKTDNIYLKAAVRQTIGKFPLLAEKPRGQPIDVKVRFYKYTDTTARILNLAGGVGDLCKIISLYGSIGKKISAPNSEFPVILFTDNDSGAKGKGGIFSKMKSALRGKPDGNEPFYFLGGNLYVVPTPVSANGDDTVIEDFFDTQTKSIKLGNKKFNPAKSGFDSKTEYGKYLFAEQVVRKHQDKINFAGFEPILERIQLVINEHAKKLAG